VGVVGCYDPRVDGGGGTIEILVSERSNLENIKEAVEALVLRIGTIECGIGGFDFTMLTERDARGGEEEEIAPGVKAVIRTRT
jgi:hypothetical protein